MTADELKNLAESFRQPLVDFCRRLIQTPSLSGHEGEVARMIRAEMEALGYDEAWIDDVGNVIGLLRGSGGGRSAMFNCHLDHVDPGAHSRWPFPPYEATLVDGAIWGRGACDIKGPLAAQVYAGGALRRGLPHLPGDVYVVGAVMEEVSGLGSIKLAETLHTDAAVVGEPSGNRLARGHRGRVEFAVRVRGRSAHARAPERGVNPHYVLARFLQRLEALPMAVDPFFGPASAAPTLYLSDQQSPNVIPAECELHVDWRTLPNQTPETLTPVLQRLLDECVAAVPGSEGEVRVPDKEVVTHTGYRQRVPDIFPSFALPEDHPLVAGSQRALEAALGHPVPIIRWGFATDGGHLMAAGIPTVGFGPGREDLTHTERERIEVDQLVEALAGNVALARFMAGAEAGDR